MGECVVGWDAGGVGHGFVGGMGYGCVRDGVGCGIGVCGWGAWVWVCAGWGRCFGVGYGCVRGGVGALGWGMGVCLP